MKSSVIKALQNLTDKPNQLFVKVLEHGSMSVKLYKPQNIYPQTPHTHDELYVIISGNGQFVNDGVRTSFQQGDVLFVKAHVVHRFENFTADFVTWVIFYGKQGGE